MEDKLRKTEGHPHSLTDIEHEIIHHTELPRTILSDQLDSFINRIGILFSWLWVITVGVILYSVISRYVFSHGSVMLEEVQWHLAGAAWLVGLSYTVVHDDHVRVDVLHERFSLKTQAWCEFLGILLLLMPFLIIALWEVIPYALSSFEQGERSQAPGGLPMRWVLKSFLPLSVGLLIVATTSRLLKVTSLLFGFPHAVKTDTSTKPNNSTLEREK
ncbi:TRAP transporter small permease subunit [Kiloniella antarctica]|uniref:TRAP transporter small permease protein n=1 Tax=Kiloniella antarctica TaxID=1550907 RepID=A0ABW5BHX4_9PROT